MISQLKVDGQTKKLQDKLLEIYDYKDHKEEILKMNDDQMLELAENLKEGIPFATPVFDGAKEKDITDLLEKTESCVEKEKCITKPKCWWCTEREWAIKEVYNA